MKIGVGITTKDRPDLFAQSYKNWLDHIPEGSKLVVIDDASLVPVLDATHRFDTTVGVAAAKNKAFELLADCDHIFLSDDDFWPVVDDWWRPYVESGEPHLMYIFENFATGVKLNDSVKYYDDGKIAAYTHPRGCMMYFRRECLDYVGGMSTEYGRYSYEHPALSNRIYNAGLTRFRFADISNSKGLFYSADEWQKAPSTCVGRERQQLIAKNRDRYHKEYYSKEHIPISPNLEVKELQTGDQNLVLTCYFTGVPDPQGRTFECDRMQMILQLSPLMSTVANNKAELTIFHDVNKPESDHPQGVHTDNWHYMFIPQTPQINPYFQRWISYREYLIKHRQELKYVWCVDATDVEMLRDPFPYMKPGILYTGDEPDRISSSWLNRHHKNPSLVKFMQNRRNMPLLNAGLLGGDVETVIDFCGKMIDVYANCEADAKLRRLPDAGLTDMAAFNYVAYTFFKPEHGPHINTEFKKFETNNTTAMWRHK